jgi:hypothetical protein
MLRPRREAFVQYVIRSPKTRWSQAQCYEAAGYRTTGHGSETAASRLLKNVEVKMRVQQLSRPAARRTELSLENLIGRIGSAIEAAERDGAHGAIASNNALLLRIVDMVRNEGMGEFAGAKDANEIMDILLDEMSMAEALALADQIREAALARASDLATPINQIGASD